MSDNYELVRRLGQGGYGIVSLMRSKDNPSELFALKDICIGAIIQRDYSAGGALVSAEKRQSMAIQEAELMKTVEHPNIVKVYSSFMEGDFLKIVMEFCDSGTLKDVIKIALDEQKAILETDICKWTRQVAGALDFVHSKNMLHRDVKTDNIFLTCERDSVKLGDFGIAKLLDGTSAGHTFIGTPHYMPPEMWTEPPRYTAKSEVWALGIVIYELAALRVPFGAGMRVPMMPICNATAPPLPTSYSPELTSFVETKMLQKKENDRPSMSDVLSFFAAASSEVITATNKYDVDRLLGRGGFGEAFLAHSKFNASQQFVVKVIKLAKFCTTKEMGEKIKQMAFQEADIMKKMQSPNIVTIFSSFLEENNFYIVMEFCDSGTLKDAICKAAKDDSSFPESHVLRWIAQLVMTLKHLHNNKILHRDVKSENIFVVNQGRTLKLGDFGIAKTLENTVSVGHTFVGTMTHIPPELWEIEDRGYSYKSEVWALGITAYEMMARELPFDAGLPVAMMTAICTRPVRPLPNEYSEQLRKLVENDLLAKNADNRPSMDALMGKPCILSAIMEMANSPDAAPISPTTSVQAKPDDVKVKPMVKRPSASGNTKQTQVSVSGEKSPMTQKESLATQNRSENIFVVNRRASTPQSPQVLLSKNAFQGEYFKHWNKKPKRRLFVAQTTIQAIVQCYSNQARTSKPSIVIVCQDGDVIAFSALNWEKIEWRRKIVAAPGDKITDKVEIWHAAYDEHADDIYAVQNLQRQAIYRVSRQDLADDASKNGVPLDAVISPQQANKRNFRGIAIDSEHRLLFACAQNDKTVTIWQITDQSSLTTRIRDKTVLLGVVSCKITPWLCAVFCADQTKEIGALLASSSSDQQTMVLAVSDTIHDRVDLFSASINDKEESSSDDSTLATSDFRFVAALSAKTPAEIAFDQNGNLFCTSFDNKRLNIFSAKEGTKTSPMQAVWVSNDCGAMVSRVAIATNPQTERPVALLASGNALDCLMD